jgi:hypothetical protein
VKTAAVGAKALGAGLVVSLALAGSSQAAPVSHSSPHALPKRAPSGAPLSASVPQREGENAGVPSAEGDQLVENGLASPLCKGSTSRLSSAAQSNCQTSGFVGASAPTNNYAFDVHIDVGTFGLSKGGLLSVIQDVFVAPLWNALVWLVHALVVLLEWCFTLELLDSSTMGGVARSLRQVKASFTEPWLVLVLAVASVLALYNGLVRRRVSETLGQALVTFAMMALGLWVIADPLGTVGAVGQWANQASLGTLGTVAAGNPANAPRTLADSMRAVFSGAIEMPWCYLEFGNVRWCSDPALLDPSLRSAATHIVAEQTASLSCHHSAGGRDCTSKGSASALALERSDHLVREANTNGKLFLAFPANRGERNSVKEKGSLLRVLCGAEDDTKCRGPTAQQAEFRSDDGTFPRMIGVVLIAGGLLGMAMLFGLVAIRLLSAAILSLFLLLLAPFAVLAPALGDSGRAVFGGWATRLLASVVSKLLFSFLLGALLSTQRILMSLELLGWWTQWLLISVFWWTVFFKRHQAIAFLQNGGHAPAEASRPSIARRVGRTLETPRAIARSAGRPKRKVPPPEPGPGPGGERSRRRSHAIPQMPDGRADEQTLRTLNQDRSTARARLQGSPGVQKRMSSMRAQLERVHRARQASVVAGDSRRAARLAVRERRVGAKLASEEKSFSEARKLVADGRVARRASGSLHTREQRELRARFLDEQAALPSSREHRKGTPQRDYPSLAGLAGHGREEYRQLAPRARREARLRIDRELAVRSRLGGDAPYVGRVSLSQPSSHEQGGLDKDFDRALEERTHPRGTSQLRESPRPLSSGLGVSESATGGESVRTVARKGGRARSSVMEDARAVAERRKRQLGYGPSQ